MLSSWNLIWHFQGYASAVVFRQLVNMIGSPTRFVWVGLALESVINHQVAVDVLFEVACCFARVPVTYADK